MVVSFSEFINSARIRKLDHETTRKDAILRAQQDFFYLASHINDPQLRIYALESAQRAIPSKL